MTDTATADAPTFGDYAKMEADLAASQEHNRILREVLDRAVERMDYLEGRILDLGGSL